MSRWGIQQEKILIQGPKKKKKKKKKKIKNKITNQNWKFTDYIIIN